MTDGEIDALIIAAADTHSLVDMSSVMVDVMTARPELTPAYFERRFRALGLDDFELVALPRDNAARNTSDPRLRMLTPEETERRIVLLMLPSEVPAEWWLYFCMRGEGAELKAEQGMDDDENLRRLETAGFLTIAPEQRQLN